MKQLFKPGESGNPQGRRKGSKNKVSESVREMISSFINESFDEVKKEFDELKGKEKVKAFIELLPYVVPRLGSTSIEMEIDNLSTEQVDELYDKIMSAAI